MDHFKKITKARSNLVLGHPFFGSLALRLKIEPSLTEGLATCDGITIRYNPEKVDELPLSKVEGMLAHTVMGPALLHHTRRGNRDAKKWDKASDYAINPMLEAAGFDLPEGTYNSAQYADQSVEQIYASLPDDPKDDKGKGQGGGQSGSQSGGAAGQDPSNGNGSEDNTDSGGDGGIKDSPNSQSQGGSKADQANEESEWKQALAQAAHVARQAGKMPAGMERLIDDAMESKLPWREILRRFMTEKADDDFSWQRGNRRFVADGLYLPSRHSEGTGEIVVVIDTSGSIGEKELNEFAAEVKDIVAESNPSKTYIIHCDARVAHVAEFNRGEELEFGAYGGGGTDFRPPFIWLAERGIEPQCFIYLTDGYGPFPEEQAAFPTLWAITNHHVTPPHGEHLILDV